MILENQNDLACYLCNGTIVQCKELIKNKPSGETDFGISVDLYQREIVQCNNCKVFNNFHYFDLDNLYSTSYNHNTYSNSIKKTYEKIMRLPYCDSDNQHRVERIKNYYSKNNKLLNEAEVLDVGSGLCVFPGELLKYIKNISCVDPSEISVRHALENIRVNKGYCGEFLDIDFEKKYDLITFNKVLEHVKNPIAMLAKAKSLLKKEGVVYIELPDGEEASKNGGFINREEFYLEHYTIFSKDSLDYLVRKIGFGLDEFGSIHEPSDKYTLFAFLKI